MVAFGRYCFEFSEETLKKSFKDFKAELDHIFKELPSDEREEKMKELYKLATGRDPERPKKFRETE